VETGMIDFLKDTCVLTIYYEETGRSINLTDQKGGIKDDGIDD